MNAATIETSTLSCGDDLLVRVRCGLWPRNLIICAFFIQLWLLILHLHLAGHSDPEVRAVGHAFDLTREATIPSAFAAIQALATAIFAGAMASISRQRKAGPRGRWLGWLLLMAVFFAIAVDDIAAIHERVNSVVSLDLIESLHYPSYPWHVIIAPWLGLGLVMGLGGAFRDLWTNPSSKAVLVLALLCFGLSQIMDFVEGWETMTQQPNAPVPAHLASAMIVEEMLEMIGTALFAYLFLSTLLTNLKERLGSRPPGPEVLDGETTEQT